MSLVWAMARIHKESARKLSKRTQNVWVAFFVTIAAAMFVLQLGSETNQTGLLVGTLASVEDRPSRDTLFSPIYNTDGVVWTSIVIHHLGQPAGTMEEVDRNHRNSGLDPHFREHATPIHPLVPLGAERFAHSVRNEVERK